MRTLLRAPERLFCEIGMLAFRLPMFCLFLQLCPRNNFNKYEHRFLRDQDWPKWGTYALFWIRKYAWTPWRHDKLWGPLKSFKMGVLGSGDPVGGSPSALPSLPMPYVGSSLICPLRAAYGIKSRVIFIYPRTYTRASSSIAISVYCVPGEDGLPGFG